MTQVLPKAGDPALKVLFCGINAPPSTAASGWCFASPGNRFWPTLHAAGFTPRLLDPSEQDLLPQLGLGITTLVARPTPRASNLTPAELHAAVPRLRETAERFRPCWIGFLGITAYRIAFGDPAAAFGPQPDGIADSGIWVLPNPSGLNRAWSPSRLAEEYGRLRAQAENSHGG